jgi:hypothetical protein
VPDEAVPVVMYHLLLQDRFDEVRRPGSFFFSFFPPSMPVVDNGACPDLLWLPAPFWQQVLAWQPRLEAVAASGTVQVSTAAGKWGWLLLVPAAGP